MASCSLSDYDVRTGSCDSDGDLEIIFTLKEGVVCNGFLPTASAECAYVPADSSVGEATVVYGVLGTFICASLIVWLVVFRNNAIIRASQPQLMLVFLLGFVAINVSSFFTIGGEGEPACVVAPRVFHLGFTSAITALIVKLYRVWQIFNNSGFKRVRVRVWDMFICVGIFICVDLGLMLASAVVAPLHSEPEKEDADGADVTIEQLRCRDGGVFLLLLWAVKIVLLLGTCGLAWATRSVSNHFAESAHVVGFIVLILLLAMTTISVYQVSDSVATETLVRSIMIFFGTAGMVCFIFAPKMKAIHDGEDSHDLTLQACKVVPSVRISGTGSIPKQIRVSSKKTARTLRSAET